jgi:hypothetical protein
MDGFGDDILYLISAGNGARLLRLPLASCSEGPSSAIVSGPSLPITESVTVIYGFQDFGSHHL